MTSTLKLLVALLLSSTAALAQNSARPGVGYNPGPDVSTEMGRRYLDILANAPDYGWISVLLIGEQRFRPVWGPTFSRMNFAPNSIVAIAIGQDLTHKAEFAKKNATAAYGAAAEDQGEHVGAKGEMGFINHYAPTINGQYGSAGSPVILLDEAGKPQSLLSVTHIDNGFWTLSTDERSLVTKTRHELLDWIFTNNQDSLRLVVLYGGAARDGFATWVQSKPGGQVGTVYDPKLLSRTRIPVMKKVSTGGNGQATYPLTKTGEDLYARVLGRPLEYKLPQYPPEGFVPDIQLARQKLKDELPKWFDEMALMEGGIEGSGLVHPAQIGGYDVAHQMMINGQNTISLKGLKISDQLTLRNHILALDFPHPTRMFINGREWAAKEFSKLMPVIEWFMQNEGYRVNPFTEALSDLEKGLPYSFDMAGTDPRTYPFGTPLNRMQSKSDAVRAGVNVIIDGSKNKTAILKKQTPAQKAKGEFPQYDLSQQIKAMARQTPHQYPPETELWSTHPRGEQYRYRFDPGPPAGYERIFKHGFPKSLIELQPTTGDFAHYRGFFQGAEALVLYTPTDLSDILTERAATGEAGQYLQSALDQRGFGRKPLILKTAPFVYQPWDPAGWEKIVSETPDYRRRLIGKVLEENAPRFIIVDDVKVQAELQTILGAGSKIPVIFWARDLNVASSGVKELAESLRFIPGANQAPFKLEMHDIPRNQLYFDAHWWEGTSGERVITASDPKFRGKVFAGVVPDWAAKQKFTPPAGQVQSVTELKDWLQNVPKTTMKLEECNLFFLDQSARNHPWNRKDAG